MRFWMSKKKTSFKDEHQRTIAVKRQGRGRLEIEWNPEILGGKPVIKGTRISVELILELVDAGLGVDEIKKEYPHLSRSTIKEIVTLAKRIHETVSYERVKVVA